ncbi:hypothetical protein ACQEVZ_40435 [Dactylosporangium sp. CA-152071]|uniref:hypothetical protein n=1 Tax=Dactylosporangium sp. CA-152071 TaxID=3239933 RepID=UPI003D8DCF3C
MDTGERSAATAQPGVANDESSSPQAPIRRKRVRLLVAAGVVVAIVVTGLGAARVAATGGDRGKLSDTGIASCARYIAEGVVTAVSSSGAGGGWEVTIQVEASLKGAEVGRPLTYRADAGSASQASVGTRVFVVVSRFHEEGVQQFAGADIAEARDWMARAVPMSHDVPCDTAG